MLTLGLTGFRSLVFVSRIAVQLGDRLLGLCDGPADGLGDFSGDSLVKCFWGRWRMGIGEPCERFGGRGFLAGWRALGGGGLFEWVQH